MEVKDKRRIYIIGDYRMVKEKENGREKDICIYTHIDHGT